MEARERTDSHFSKIFLADNADPEEIIEGRNIFLHYGKIEIFQERTQYVSFCRPLTEHNIEYTIVRDPRRKIVKESFEPDHWEGVLNPNEDFNLPIIYKPTLASTKDVEVFAYLDNDYEIIKITVTGQALGPHCTTSSKKIVFYKTPQKSMLQGQLEITNDSRATAHFKIDYSHADIFKITPTEGIIKPDGYQLLTVKFCPTKIGFFARKIFCLIWNSDPLVFDLLGYYDDHYIDIEAGLKYYNFSADQSYGFGAYLYDSLVIRNDAPPYIINPMYLDFGCIQVDNQGAERIRMITLKNYMKKDIVVEWEKGTQIFKVTPDTALIPPSVTAQFLIEFRPDEDFNTFAETLVAQINWKIEKGNLVEDHRRTSPMMGTVRVQGYSFPENEGWITHIEILPEVVYWQPCLPGEKVYTTFRLQNKSHLPVMYKLVPPKYTNVVAKPMSGKFRNFEIIAIVLQTEKNKPRTYIEEWKLITNGAEKKQMSVFLHGETSIPTIEIGTKNKINGGNIQEGSQKTIKVTMKNTSYFTIGYRFQLKERSALMIEPMSGVIEGNEQTKLEVTVSGIKCASKREKFICEMHIIERNGATSGETYETVVEIFSVCSYSELSACPSSENFGNQPFGKKITCEFEAVNFGDSPIYFQTSQCGEEIRDPNFRIHPCFGEVDTRDCKTFIISGIMSLVGEQTLQFGYYNRVSRDSPMVTGDPTVFFTLTYNAEFPTVQIEEIVEHNFGPLFGKPDLFHEYFNIPRFNHILKGIAHDETLEMFIRVPEIEVQDKIFSVTLAITNVSPYDTTINLTRKKLCNCQLVEKTDGANFTQRKKGFDCPHREVVTMELQDTRFFSSNTCFLTIDLKYHLPKVTKMCYIMQLSNRRAVEIYFKVFAIPSNIPRVSFYKDSFRFDLKPIYIGMRVAPIQMFWVYNNTSKLVNLTFNTTEIEYMCKMEGFNVLEIVNPKDQILPYSSKGLLVKFHPIELKTYRVQIELKYQNPGERARILDLEIEGRGIIGTRRGSITDQPFRLSKFSGNFPISLSIECIDIKILPVWNKRKKLIFIKSNAKNKIIQYVWGTTKIDNVLEISVERKYGLLNPREVHPVVLVIKSFSEPCIASMTLPLEIINYTDLVLHEITKEKHKEAQDRIDNEFTLKGQNIKIPTNPIKIHPKPEILYTAIILNITTVHSRDLDLNMDPKIQFKQYPNQSMENIPKNLVKSYCTISSRSSKSYPEKGKAEVVIGTNEKKIYCRILEEVIGDALNSAVFKQYLKIHSKAPLHYYDEFVMDDKQIMSKKMVKTPLTNEDIAYFRQREIEKFFARPKITELSNILQNIIFESVSKMVQCYCTDFNIKEIYEQIESSLYVCKKKTCSCNKTENT